jgi:uncharacterized membrane protein
MSRAAIPAAQPLTSRIAGIDALRGGALLAMIVYHGAWDLAELGLIETDIAAHRLWTLFARGTTCAFLLLVGVGLTLAARRGSGLGRFHRRLATIAAAAGLVSLATYWAEPGGGVFFGILHCIALSSLFAGPLLRAPSWLLALAAAAVLAAPQGLASPVFNAWPWYWLGLSTQVTPAPDYVPMLPWFGLVLLGIIAGRAVPAQASLAARGGAMRALAWAGRHSLAIYLLHQPLLLGLIFLAAPFAAPAKVVSGKQWMPGLVAECGAAGEAAAPCAEAIPHR